MKKKNIDLSYFQNLLEEYRQGKLPLTRRYLASEEYWRTQSTPLPGGEGIPSSGWLTNCILSKHADAVEAYPMPVILPREPGDTPEAEMLSRILPALLDRADFPAVWSKVWWQKLRTGAGVYGVFWDRQAGDIAIRRVSPLSLFWEPGVEDLQLSPAVFYLQEMPAQNLLEQYPSLKKSALNDPMITVVDVYYKRGGKLHYLQYAENAVLFSTYGRPEFAQGLYHHGLYPFVPDALFPLEGYPGFGFGYVDLLRPAQAAVDMLGSAMLKNALCAATPRWFVRTDGAVDQSQYADFTQSFVQVRGSVDGESIAPMPQTPLPDVYVELLQQKITEIKEVSGNRDVNNGSTSRSVTAAAAITALQEAGNALSRDMVSASYRAFKQVVELCIALLRQFYTQERIFRIVGSDGKAEFVAYNNARLLEAAQLDIQVEVEKQTSLSRGELNELALEMFKQRVFDPENRQQAMALLEMMEFRGRDRLRKALEAPHGE